MKNTQWAHYQRTAYNPRHYRFERRIEGYHPVPDSPSWAWWIAGAVCGLILLVLAVMQ